MVDGENASCSVPKRFALDQIVGIGRQKSVMPGLREPPSMFAAVFAAV
jgi:hypothetical protein